MSHEFTDNTARNYLLECGDCQIIIKDPSGLEQAIAKTGFAMPIYEGRFDADESNILTELSFKLRPAIDTISPRVEATIGYVPNAECTTKDDLEFVVNTLVKQKGYEKDTVTPIAKSAGTSQPGFTVKLGDDSLAIISIYSTPHSYKDGYRPSGKMSIRSAIKSNLSDSNKYERVESILQFWGDVTDAIAYPEKGAHLTPRQTLIEIPAFQASDASFDIWNVFIAYEHRQQAAEITLPYLNLLEMNVDSLIDAFNGHLTPAHVALALEYLIDEGRVIYGKTGKITSIELEGVVITLHRIMSA